MEQYFNLVSPLNEYGVFTGDGDNTPVNQSIRNLPTMSDYLNSLRQQLTVELPSTTQQQSDNQYLEDMNLPFDELLKQEGIQIRVTSRLRPGAKTKSGHTSHHSHTDEWGNSAAMDIVPVDGNFDKLKNDIYSNPRIKAWLVNHNKGILEETTPDVMKKTGATGKHFHVGPDRWARQMSSNYLNYNGAPAQQSVQYSGDGKMGSKAFPLGGGKKLDPNGNYTLFHTFGYGTDKRTKHSGVECSKKVINTLIGYMDKGCNTLQDLIMMYHLGMRGSWDQVKSQIRAKGGLRDQGSGRWISANEWIKMQEAYQKQCADYMHMPINTRVSKTREFLYPLVTFISRQEQGVNSEAATAIALQEMRLA